MEKNEKKLIELPKTNAFIRWLLISSLLLVCVTLIVSWLLWFNLNHARDTLEKFLSFLQNDLFVLGFWGFSAIIFTFAGLALSFSLPLIFIKHKNTTNNIFSFLNLILTMGIFGFGLFANLYIIKKHVLIGDISFFAKENLIVVIPFYLIMLFSLIGIIASLVNLIFVSNKVKIKEEKKVAKKLIKPVQIAANTNLKSQPIVENKIVSPSTNNLVPKTLATIRVIVPASSIKNTKEITDNIKIYQNEENVNLDFNISE
ncbi:hypothetical protein LT336_00017 [Spiroplasma sp. JKS002671]|uniref:hypothetical protein n=1 Tax=Spiroplasma attinicola TaxID=2904537 RepID=UPI002022B40D|nr:hypothetical protein [Spiroplasma sp. JKS002671]MCL8210291.1 hypothetical protein [Spiroplasma sp. JKS002671]